MMDSDHIRSHRTTPVRIWPTLVVVTRQEEVERLGKKSSWKIAEADGCGRTGKWQ